MTLWLKLGLAAGALLLLFGAYEAWAYHERELGAQKIIAADAKAIAEQKTKDAALSAQIVNDQAQAMRALSAAAQPIRERIIHVPVTMGCGPAVGAAVDGVRSLLGSPGGPPAGSKPPAALRAPGAAPGPGNR